MQLAHLRGLTKSKCLLYSGKILRHSAQNDFNGSNTVEDILNLAKCDLDFCQVLRIFVALKPVLKKIRRGLNSAKNWSRGHATSYCLHLKHALLLLDFSLSTNYSH